jgi:hypothetical protein
MVDVSGIPNMGFGGGGYFGGSASMGLPAMSADQINASMGWNPNAAQYDPWANTPGGFGGQTDYYSSLGAAYGRETGGFSGGGGYPSGTVEYGGPLPDIPHQDIYGRQTGGFESGADYMSSLWGGGASPFADYGQSAIPDTSWYQQPSYDYSAYSPWGGGGADFSYLYNQPQAATPSYDWGSYFTDMTGGQQQANPYTGGGAGYDYYDPSSYGLGTSWQTPAQPNYGSLGYDPSIFGGGFQSAPGSMFDANYYGGGGGGGGGGKFDPFTGEFLGGGGSQPDYSWSGNFYGAYGGGGIGDYGYAPGYGGFDNSAYQPQQDFSSMWSGTPAYDPSSFANRFSDWGSNYGTPSQYYTGDRYGGGGGMPPGFSGTYGVDSPGGALPLRNTPLNNDPFQILPGGG